MIGPSFDFRLTPLSCHLEPVLFTFETKAVFGICFWPRDVIVDVSPKLNERAYYYDGINCIDDGDDHNSDVDVGDDDNDNDGDNEDNQANCEDYSDIDEYNDGDNDTSWSTNALEITNQHFFNKIENGSATWQDIIQKWT